VDLVAAAVLVASLVAMAATDAPGRTGLPVATERGVLQASVGVVDLGEFVDRGARPAKAALDLVDLVASEAHVGLVDLRDGLVVLDLVDLVASEALVGLVDLVACEAVAGLVDLAGNELVPASCE